MKSCNVNIIAFNNGPWTLYALLVIEVAKARHSAILSLVNFSHK